MKYTFFIIFILLGLTSCSIYQKYYDQAYKIAQAMTLEQKVGQTIQIDFTALNKGSYTDPQLAKNMFFGSLLIGGDGTPDDEGNIINLPNDQYEIRRIYSQGKMSKWQKLSRKFNYSIIVTTKDGTRYDIKPLLGTDAVHGNQHVAGTILFPHNSGLACTHNPENFYNAGYWTSVGVKESGFNYAFAPTVAVSHNPQWGRFYETMGQEQELITEFAKQYTLGIQGQVGKSNGLIGSAKHFYGDGSTLFGADQGNSIVSSFQSFVSHNTKGYIGSIQAQIGSVMVSYSGINFILNSVSPSINTILRQKLKFDGLIISDYDEIRLVMSQKLPSNFGIMDSPTRAVATLVNAGIDMLMLPGWRGISAASDAINGYISNIKDGNITQQRLNDAVARILSVKLAIGAAFKSTSQSLTIENNNIIQQQQQSPKHSSLQYEDSLKAVQQSLVLLKNQNILPINTDKLQYIILVGQRIININNKGPKQLFRNFDNIGMQNGGWTLRWQGFEGNSQWLGQNKQKTKATSILDALNNLNLKTNILFPKYSSIFQENIINNQRITYLSQLQTLRNNMNSDNTLILSVIGQTTFAEFKGDVGIPYCLSQDFNGYGCMYKAVPHAYLPQKQRSNLAIDFQTFDKQVISKIKQKDQKIPLLTVILAGRPLLIQNIINQSQAVLDAWLPGTSGGEGIINAITGKYRIRPNGDRDNRNTLAFDWPKDQQSLSVFPVYAADGQIPRIKNRLFSVGYGLSTANKVIEEQ